jgi:hypothetical protein
MDSDGDPMVTWSDNSDMFFSRWDGAAFTTPITLNPGGVSIAGPGWMGPDVASKGDTVYAVYKQTPEIDTSSHIWCVSSFDGGMTFNTPVRVEYIGTNISRFPTIAVDAQGHPLVGFMEFASNLSDPQWVVVKSTDFGGSFGQPVLASGWSSGVAEVCDCCPSKIVSEGNTVAMPYRDNDNNIRDTWVGISTDGGVTFTSGMDVDQQGWNINVCPSSGPDGVIVGDTLYTTYMTAVSGAARVYYNKSSISAMNGSPAIDLDQTTPTLLGQQNYPRVDYHGGSMAFVWYQYSNGAQELAIQFTEDISTGINPVQEIVDTDNIDGVDVALYDGNIWVVWEDDASGTVKYRSGTYNSIADVDKLEVTDLSVYPNPSKDYWNIESEGLSIASEILLISVDGTLIDSFESDNSKLEIDNSALSSGVYLLELKTNEGVYRIRMIKE